MKFINFTVVRFAILLVLGILAAHYFPISYFLLKTLLFLFCLTSILWLITRNQLIQPVYFGIVTYLCFFAIGYFTYQLRLPHFQRNHFSHIAIDDTRELIQIKVLQSLKPDRFNNKYFAQIQALNGKPTTGKILLNISKDSLTKILISDEILLVYGSITGLPEPLNPHQFDYSKYMKSQGVYGQLRISEKEILQTIQGSKTIFGTAQNLRAQIVEKLKKSKLETNERAIVQALILGEKKDIDKNLYEEYAAAGAVHILAVSGLHVAILYAILAFFFQPLKRWKYGIFLHSILVVLLLWTFAVLSGLSPSVTRAVTMFSFFAFAQLSNRRSNGINTLFLSLLTLLIINPLWLFQVGFQLSYLAIFFILWLHPILYKIGYSKNLIIRKIWGYTSVTLCAQIGVLPLSLYYFHQFPGLFIITNIVVLPFLTILMCGGLLIVFLAVLDSLPGWLSEIYNTMIEALNGFIHWIAIQEDFLFKEIHFSSLKVLATYLLLSSLVLLVRKINYFRFAASLLSVSVLIAVFIYDEFKNSSSHLMIFHKSGNTLIGHTHGRKMTLFRNDFALNAVDSYPIKSYRTAMNIKNYSEANLPGIFRYEEKNILVLDSLSVFPKQGKIHTVILTKSPRVNLVRLIDSLKPNLIVADGNNYYSYKKRWEKTCQIKKLPFFDTAEQGAFLIE